MVAHPGYYSLVQFCPDYSRLEAVNVGLVLFCEPLAFLGVRLVESNKRVARVFGKDSFRPRSLRLPLR